MEEQKITILVAFTTSADADWTGGVTVTRQIKAITEGARQGGR